MAGSPAEFAANFETNIAWKVVYTIFIDCVRSAWFSCKLSNEYFMILPLNKKDSLKLIVMYSSHWPVESHSCTQR